MTSQEYRALIHKRNKKKHQKKLGARQVAKLHKLRATERDNDPSQITRPLTPKTLREETNAAIRTKFGPQEQSFNQELGLSDVQQQHITNWFDQYKASIAAAAQSTAGAYGTAASQIRGDSEHASSADEERRKALMDTMSKDAAMRGAKLDPGLEQQSQQAISSRAAASNAALAETATIGANSGAYLADTGRIAGLAQTQEHLRESTRKNQIYASLRDLAGQKGDFAVEYRANARGSERNAQIADAAGLLKGQQVATQTRLANSLVADRKNDNKQAKKNARQRKMEADRKYRLDKKKLGQAAARDAYQRRTHTGPYKPAAGKGRGGGGGSAAPKETEGARGIRAAIYTVRAEYAAALKRSHGDHAKAAKILRDSAAAKKQSLPPYILEAAADLVNFGYIRAARRRQLRALGLNVPRNGKF